MRLKPLKTLDFWQKRIFAVVNNCEKQPLFVIEIQ